MRSVVVMTGGGVKGAVAAARYASDHEVFLLHAGHGRASAAQETNALAELVSWFPKARLVTLDLSHITEIQRIAKTEQTTSATSAVERGGESADGLPPALMRGLMPTLVSAAVQTALRVGAASVATGLTRWASAEHLGLPDDGTCDRKREFIHSVNIMLDALLKPQVKLCFDAPLMDSSYAAVVKLGVRFGVPFEKTWTCVGPGPRPCDTCEPCKARARAFIEAGVPDPAMAAPTA